MSSKDPGTLGFYGFRNRGDYSYEKNSLVNSNSVKTDRVWDIVSRVGKKVITVGVPQTYPPKPVNGIQVGCFLSPFNTEVQGAQPLAGGKWGPPKTNPLQIP